MIVRDQLRADKASISANRIAFSHGLGRLRMMLMTTLRIVGFLARVRDTADQLNPVQRWYRIPSEALKRYRKGRQLDPPPRLAPA